MLRLILGLLAGLAVAIVCVLALEIIGHLIFPPPEGVNLKDPDTLNSLMSDIPLGAKISVLAAWFIGALAGGVTAAMITEHGWAGWAIAGIMLAVIAMTLTTIPHPTWMVVISVTSTLLAGFLASRSAPRTG